MKKAKGGNAISSFSTEDEDGRTWLIEANVTFGSPGTYWDPPDGGEVEILTATEDMEEGQFGPAQVLDFDDFVELYQLPQREVDQIESDLYESAESGADDDYADYMADRDRDDDF
jgi:hypothetical protein